MEFIKPILWVADPIFVAFMMSVLIGVLFKNFSGILLLKYASTFFSVICYLALIVYAGGILKNDIVYNIVLFAPLVFFGVFIILAFIFAPKEMSEESEMDKEFETKKFITGWDSLFPNDLDEYDKNSKD